MSLHLLARSAARPSGSVPPARRARRKPGALDCLLRAIRPQDTKPGRPTRSRAHLVVVATAAAGLLLVGGAGAALAYWSAHAAGTGSVTTGSLTFAAETTTTTGALGPGTSSTVSITLHNPNPGGITILSLTGGPAQIVQAGVGACSASVVSFVAQSGLTVAVPAGGSATVDGVVSMSTSAGNGCQQATFVVPVTARAEQS
jgi:hypothetical protein